MDFGKTNNLLIGKINKELEKILKEWRREAEKLDVNLVPLADKFIKGCRGGKRMRGVLVILGYFLEKKFSISNLQFSNKEIIRIAAAYEVFHTAILAHDDVIDQSLLRRRQPSLYQALGGNHKGISQAICLGDSGFFLATRVITESDFSDNAKIKALKLFSRIMLDTAAGEMLDVERGNAFTVMKLKTARYSISGPLQLGSILASGEQKLINDLELFGKNLGIAFQIQDDILGIFGSEKITGKSNTSDIEEGKNTLLYIQALKNADKKERETLRKLYGRGKIHGQEVKTIRQLFQKTGALDFAKEAVLKHKMQALKVLPLLTKDEVMSKLFEQLVEGLVERTK